MAEEVALFAMIIDRGQIRVPAPKANYKVTEIAMPRSHTLEHYLESVKTRSYSTPHQGANAREKIKINYPLLEERDPSKSDQDGLLVDRIEKERGERLHQRALLGRSMDKLNNPKNNVRSE